MKVFLRDLIQSKGVDAVLLTHLPNIRWACGFTGSRALLIVNNLVASLLTDPRYLEQVQDEVDDARVYVQSGGFPEIALQHELLRGARRVLFQSDHLTVRDLNQWRKTFPAVEWVPGERILTHAVACKSEEEIVSLRRAQQITDSVFEHILPMIAPGIRERDLAAEIIRHHILRGADKMSFEPIVASGPGGARPHGRASGRRLEKGDLVVLDFGCFFQGYASDMTRTIAMGEPGPKARSAYAVVLEAQRRAIEEARPGRLTDELDKVARDVIGKAGYGEYFGHGLGHGVGLEVHEWPFISPRAHDELPSDVVITIEPGIYIPGQFGIRIEDALLLGQLHGERLGTSPQELIVL